MRILVTGGAGFIGSNLVAALVDSGHDAGVVDDLSTGTMDNLHPAAWFREADILDPALPEIVAPFAPQAIVHLAAQSSVTVSLRDPARTHAVNVEGTRAVARLARERGAKLVSASSAAVYGEPARVPLPETASKAPTNAYGDSKLAAELVLIEELAGAEADFASVRFANVYGPRQDALGEGGVVAIFSGAMAAGEAPVIDGDGGQTRDFVYVGDVVKALLEALTTHSRLAVEGLDGPAYNISTGEEVSVADLAGRLRSLSRFPGELRHGPARAGDVARSALDPEKAHRVFGWRAGVPLDTGLELTLAWFAERR